MRAAALANVRECPGAGRASAVPAPVLALSARLLLVALSAGVDTSRISAFSVFADLPATELNELAGAIREVEVEAGAKVITVDDYGSAIYFIEEGEADVLTDGHEATQVLGPGDTFGEIALLLTGERTATVVARTPMRLLSLSGQDFERVRARVPELESSLRQLGLERARR
jgi:CRP-like cAMP-binding protein